MSELSTSTSAFTFVPVRVARGRKWKGELAYMLTIQDSSFCLYHGRGGYIQSETAKMWDPATKRFVYANADFVEDVELPAEQVEAARKEYVDLQIRGTIAWCKSKKPDAPEAEIMQFARNCIRKQHPEFDVYLVEYGLTDRRDVVDAVERTLSWAMQLKTRPCFMYGRHCPGGRPLPDEKKIRIARKSLHTKGIDLLDGFAEAWELSLTIRGLVKYLEATR